MILMALGLCSASATTISSAEPVPAAVRDGAATPRELSPAAGAAAADDAGAAAKKETPKPAPLFPLEPAWSHALNTPLAVWPAYDDASMYVALTSGELVALGMTQDGAISRWSVPDIQATFPLAADGSRVYVATDDAVRALDAATGKSVWHHPAGGNLSTAPVARAGWLLLALDTGDVRALRGETGEEVWKIALGAPVKSEPVIDGNRLYLSPQDNRIVALDLLSGKVLWEKNMGAFVNSVAAYKEGVYVGTTGRMFYALSDRDGAQRWKWRIGNDAIGRALFTDTRVYVVFMDNSIRAFGLDNGGQRWRQPIDFRAHPGALRIEDTIVVIGLSPVLRGFRTEDGKPAGNFTLPVENRAQVAAPLRFVQGSYFLEDLIVAVTQEGDIVAVRRKAAPLPVPLAEPVGGLADPIVWPILETAAPAPAGALPSAVAPATAPAATTTPAASPATAATPPVPAPGAPVPPPAPPQ